MRAAVLVILAACNPSGSSEPPRMDGPFTEPMQDCYGTGLVNVCFFPQNRQAVTLTGTFSTTTTSRCSSEHPECVIIGSSVSIAGLRVIGDRALIVVAEHRITVDGVLDASSKRGSLDTGPGASTCNVQLAVQQGGGVGGTYGGRGGNGGAGGGLAAQASATAMTTQFRGGCPGGRGDGTQAGAAGAGGGAVFLISREQIMVNGSINASGAGGGAAAAGGGGGGGGGGLIGLDAPTIMIAGSVFANGGGGGEGGPSGAPGADATLDGAPGGTGNLGGDGGAGAAGTTKIGTDGAANATGAGGGGGGAGIVMIIPPQATGGTISPAP